MASGASVALPSAEERLATAPGERPMRPEFGCRVHDFVFAPADATTAGVDYSIDGDAVVLAAARKAFTDPYLAG